MRNIILLLALSLFVFSCKKTTKGESMPAADSTATIVYYLSSMTDYSGGGMVKDSFSYDANHNISALLEYSRVYANAPGDTDKAVFIFSFPNSAGLPTQYYTPGGDTVHIFYDTNNRITEDSAFAYIDRYSYTSNNIAHSFYMLSGLNTYTEISADSTFIVNGNISTKNYYGPNSQGIVDSLTEPILFSYSSSSNPEYTPQTYNTIGPLLTVLIGGSIGGINTDFISKNALNGMNTSAYGQSSIVGYHYTLNSKNEVTGGTYGPYGLPADTLVFNYY